MQAVIECQASLRIATPSVTAANTLGPEGGLFTRSGSAAHPFLVKLPASAYRRQAQGGASGRCKDGYRVGFLPAYPTKAGRGIQPTCP